jgi:hypothetical protein
MGKIEHLCSQDFFCKLFSCKTFLFSWSHLSAKTERTATICEVFLY